MVYVRELIYVALPCGYEEQGSTGLVAFNPLEFCKCLHRLDKFVLGLCRDQVLLKY